MSMAADGHRCNGPNVRSGCKPETTTLLSGCRQQTRSLETGFESVWNEIRWLAGASHLYYSAGWLFESEQAAMLSLHKSRCMLAKGSHARLLRPPSSPLPLRTPSTRNYRHYLSLISHLSALSRTDACARLHARPSYARPGPTCSI
jgi:hypothetical protein